MNHDELHRTLEEVLAQGENVRKIAGPIIKILRFFKFLHLPPHLREVSAKFTDLALEVAALGDDPEVTVSLRKLLEAKDAAVRAKVG